MLPESVLRYLKPPIHQTGACLFASFIVWLEQAASSTSCHGKRIPHLSCDSQVGPGLIHGIKLISDHPRSKFFNHHQVCGLNLKTPYHEMPLNPPGGGIHSTCCSVACQGGKGGLYASKPCSISSTSSSFSTGSGSGFFAAPFFLMTSAAMT